MFPNTYNSNKQETEGRYGHMLVDENPYKQDDTQQVPLDHSSSFEQQSSTIQANLKDEPDFDFTLSNVNLKHLKETPLRMVADKSPMLDKDETNALFPSFPGSNRQTTTTNELDDSSDNLR